MTKKLGVIVPYRDRKSHLDEFIKHIKEYLNDKGIIYEIFIIEQDTAKLFNRGMLLNIGFKYAKKLSCDYVVFHDVDMLPIDVDYSYSEHPIHLATKLIDEDSGNEKLIFDEYFGGVTMFPTEMFEKIDGYSNEYWGWGYEDDDLLLRCKKNEIPLNVKRIKNNIINKQSLYFNGSNSYVKINNKIDLNKNLTFFVSFSCESLIYNHKKESDIFTIFSIPGYDTSISYTSFLRYNFCTFDENKEVLYINSEIKPTYSTTICVTIDIENRIIKMYQDGIFVNKQNRDFTKLLENDENCFYLGCGDPTRKGDERFFKGFINSFMVFKDVLNEEEITDISNNERIGNRNLLLSYKSSKIKNYKLWDLSGNANHGEIFNCEIKDNLTDEYEEIKVPFRRDSVFKCLKHEDNGFFENKWKDKSTRWNQLRFNNEVSLNDELIRNEGLSDLLFVEYRKTCSLNVTHVKIGI